MELKVELFPHIGKMRQQVGDKVVEMDVDHKQMMVHCNGERIGIYCGTQDQPGKHLSFTTFLAQPIQDAIRDKVAAMVGGVGPVTSIPPDEHEVSDDSE